MKEKYFAKSFEEDFVLKTLKGKKKQPSQSIDNILKTNIIQLNTKSFGEKMRLSTTILHKNYLKTYRAQGLLFKTKDKPDFIYPLDLLLLTDAKKIIVQYYRIKNNLHMYYNHNLICGFEKFVFKDISKMLKEFPTLKKVWKEVNKFRVNAGHKALQKQKYRLIEYNECIFHKPVKIKPIAIFGYKKISKDIAKKYNLPCFRNAKEFYNSL